MFKLAAAALISGAACCSPAFASDDVQALLIKCNAESSSLDVVLCLGRISGMSDLMGFNGYLLKSGRGSEPLRQFSTCPGDPIPTYGADVQAFKNWAQKHPEHWTDPDILGVIAALRETWPCP